MKKKELLALIKNLDARVARLEGKEVAVLSLTPSQPVLITDGSINSTDCNHVYFKPYGFTNFDSKMYCTICAHRKND